MVDSANALQELAECVFVALSTDPTLVAGTAEPSAPGGAPARVGVFEHVPEKQPTPFISLGEVTASNDDDDEQDGLEATFTLHHWSEYRGMKEVRAMMSRARAILHNQEFTTANWQVVLIVCEFLQTMDDPDGITRHGVQRFRCMLTQRQPSTP